MQVIELAEDLKVETDALIALLRQMGIPVADEQATITDGQKAKVLAKVERERRAGRKDPAEAIRAAVEETASSSGRRRRRRRRGSDEPQESEEVESESEDESSEVEAEAAAEAPEPEEDAESDEDEAAEAEAEAPEADDEEAEDVEAEADDEFEAEADDEEEEEDEEDVAIAEAEEPEAEGDGPPEEKAEGGRSRPAPASARTGAPDAPVRSIRRPTPAPAASAGPGGQVRIQAEGYTPDGRRKRKDKKKGKRRQGVDQDAVQSNIQRVMAEIKGGSGGGKKRRRKGQRPSAEEQEQQEEQVREEQERERTTVRVNEFLTVAELSELVDATSTEIIGSAFKNLGLMVTINQRLDFDQIELLLDEFGYTAVLEEDYSDRGRRGRGRSGVSQAAFARRDRHGSRRSR